MDSLRKAFDAKFPSPCSQFDDCDVQRLHENDVLATKYLEACNGNVENALIQIEKSFAFRKEMKLNTLQESYFPLEARQKGSIFYHNKDKKGNKILYFRIKDNVKKDAAETALVKLYVAYLIEKEHRKDQGQQIVILFDMTGAGLSNFDTDLVRYIITCFQIHFPMFLAYLLVFDMPFILNAAWKLIRNWLDERAREKVIFVKQNSVSEFIAKDQLWSHMGGTDNYEFVYEPPSVSNNGVDDLTASTDSSASCRRKKKPNLESDSLSNSLTHSSRESPMNTAVLAGHACNTVNAFHDLNRSRHCSNSHVHFGPFRLIVTPPDQIQFFTCDETRCFILRNPTDSPVAFKVNTTRPEVFRVRPSSGLLPSQEQTEVSVTIKSGDNNPGNARFQILGIQVAADASRISALAQLKTASKESMFEMRVGCCVGAKEQPPESDVAALPSMHHEHSSQIDELQKQQRQIMEKLDNINLLLRILCVLAVAFLLSRASGIGNGSAAPPPCQPTPPYSG